MRITHGTTFLADAPHAVTVGKFDGVHRGHQAMLLALIAATRRLGVASCVLTFEPNPIEVLAPDLAPPRLTPLREKLCLFREAGIDRVHVCRVDPAFLAMSAGNFVEDILVRGLAARHVLVGEDFRFGARRSGDAAFLQQAGQAAGFAVEIMPGVSCDGARVSSTLVRQALADGDLARAAALLGRPYRLSGRVVHGDQIARQLGVPTANVRMKLHQPALSGIFAVRVHGIETRPLPGVASLGLRPSLGHDGRWTLEAHLFDFGGNLYGRHVSVEFLHRLRGEQKYSDFDTLVAQIHKDVADARSWLAAHADV